MTASTSWSSVAVARWPPCNHQTLSLSEALKTTATTTNTLLMRGAGWAWAIPTVGRLVVRSKSSLQGISCSTLPSNTPEEGCTGSVRLAHQSGLPTAARRQAFGSRSCASLEPTYLVGGEGSRTHKSHLHVSACIEWVSASCLGLAFPPSLPPSPITPVSSSFLPSPLAVDLLPSPPPSEQVLSSYFCSVLDLLDSDGRMARTDQPDIEG